MTGLASNVTGVEKAAVGPRQGRAKRSREDGKAPAPDIDAPQALSLRREPVANVERYDTLRNMEVRHAS